MGEMDKLAIFHRTDHINIIYIDILYRYTYIYMYIYIYIYICPCGKWDLSCHLFS